MDNNYYQLYFNGNTLEGKINITSSKNLEKLIRVLQAQKAAFEVLEEYKEKEEEEKKNGMGR